VSGLPESSDLRGTYIGDAYSTFDTDKRQCYDGDRDKPEPG